MFWAGAKCANLIVITFSAALLVSTKEELKIKNATTRNFVTRDLFIVTSFGSG
jgi:hypothetical protein